jgi:hypothetical protein
VECGLGTQELIKESEKWNVETPAVLVRVKDRSPGLACGFSTAAARWRPTGVRGNRGARGAGQRGGATAAGRARVTLGKREAGDERRRQVQSGSQGEGRSAPATEQRSRGAEGAQRKKKREKGLSVN